MKLFNTLLIPVLVLSFAACDSTDPDDGGTLEVQIASDIAADPIQRDENGQPIGEPTNQFALFNLETGTLVLAHDENDRSDSLSVNWDIGFHGLDIIANTTNGSEGGIQLLENTFEEVAEAPASEYEATLAEDWYNYNMNTHIVTPLPGRVLVVRTAEGNYAKIRIVSYYEDAPTEPTGTEPARYYTFEYVVQPDGTRDFPLE